MDSHGRCSFIDTAPENHVVGDYLVCLGGEEDLLVTMSPTTPYIDAAEEAVECSFRAFEDVNALGRLKDTRT